MAVGIALFVLWFALWLFAVILKKAFNVCVIQHFIAIFYEGVKLIESLF